MTETVRFADGCHIENKNLQAVLHQVLTTLNDVAVAMYVCTLFRTHNDLNMSTTRFKTAGISGFQYGKR